jgi:prefoldin subunit 5
MDGTMMKKILDKLSAFSKLPQTRKEKFLTWCQKHDELILNTQFFSVFFIPLLFTPFRTMVLNIFQTGKIDIFEMLFAYILFMIPSSCIVLILLLISITTVERNEKHPNKNYESSMFNYLKENKEGETKEFLLKIKLLMKSTQIKYMDISKLRTNFEKLLSEIKSDVITEDDIKDTTQAIIKKSTFLSSYEEKLELSIDELRQDMIQTVAQKLTKSREEEKKQTQSLDNFLDSVSESQPPLFKKEKVLTNSL